MLFRKLIIPTLLFLQAQLIFAQDTLYFDRYYEVQKDSTGASFLEIRKYNPKDNNQVTVVLQQTNGKFVALQKYSDYENRILNGRCSYWYPNGSLHQEATYVNDKLQGLVNTYYESGQLKRRLTFDNDTIVNGSFYNEDGSTKTSIYQEDLEQFIIHVMPAFPGGEEKLQLYLAGELNYPVVARENNIQGTVQASFVVSKQGIIRDINILDSPHESLSDEVIRLIKNMPRWEPGRVGVLPVNVRFTLPVYFRLE